MANRSIRLPDSLDDELVEEADDAEKTVSEHIRDILRQRDQIDDHDRVDELEDRLAEVEARLSELEADDRRHGDASGGADASDEDSVAQEEESLTQPSSASQDAPDAGGESPESSDAPDVDVKADQRRAEAEEEVEGLTLHGRFEKYDTARKDALLFAWDFLRDRGSATGREISTAVAQEFGYDALQYSPSDDPDRYPAYSLFRGFLSDALRELPGVDPYTGNEKGGEWRYVDG